MGLPVTPGTGATLAADQIGTASAPTTGQLLDYVKLDVGAAGSSSPVTTANPCPVQVTNGTQNMPTGDAVARPVFTKHTDGTNVAGVGKGAEAYTSSGGTSTGTVATGAANTVIKNSAGRLCRVLVTTAGTGSGNVLIYDNATTNSGTVIGVIPATIAIGTYYTIDLPAANGITVNNVANGPALTVGYN